MRRLLIIVVLLTVIFASHISLAQNSEGHPHGILSSAGKRFVFGQISLFGRDRFMLDTETGRLWQFVVDDKQNYLLQSVPYLMINGKRSLNAPSKEQDLENLNK